MQKAGMVLVMGLGVLAALLLGGAGMLGYSGFGMDSGMMSGVAAMIAPTYLVIIIGLGLLLVVWLSHPRTQPATAKISSTSALENFKNALCQGRDNKRAI